MNAPATAAPRRARRFVLVLAVLGAALAALYALAGFVLLPRYAERALPRLLAEQLQRPARVETIAFNPFTLRLDVAGFALTEPDGSPLVAVRHASVDLEWRSLMQRAAVFAAVRLEAPQLDVVVGADGALNLAALGGRADPAAPPPAGAPPAALPRVIVERFDIEHGTVNFADRRVGFSEKFEELRLQLSALSTLPAADGRYALSARTDGGASLEWDGAVTLAPLAASGTLKLGHEALAGLQPFVKDHLRATLGSGRADLALPYRFAVVDGKPTLTVADGRLAVEDFAMTAEGADKPFLRFARLAVEGIGVDLRERALAIGTLRLEAPDLRMRRDASGALDLAALARPRPPSPPSAPWRTALGSLEIAHGTLAIDDGTTGLVHAYEELALRLRDVTGDFSRPIDFDLAAQSVGGGRLAARGRVDSAGSLDARLDISALSMPRWQPQIARQYSLVLQAGEASLAGTLKSSRGNAALVFKGSAGISNLQINDPAGVPLVGWQSLATSTLTLQIPSMLQFKSLAKTTLREQLVPTQLRIDALHWQAPRMRIAIAADRSTNLRRALAPPATAAPPAAAAPASAGDAQASAAATAPSQTAAPAGDAPAATLDDSSALFEIRRIEMRQGTLDFSDDSLGGGFATGIRELNGTLNGISSDRGTRSQLSLEGRVDEFGYARVSGSLNPFLPRDRSNVRVEFRNLDLVKVTPYLVRFAGRKIASGRLSLDLDYRVRDNQLAGDNKILLEQFTLGEKVDSPGAMSLPLDLAIALLKDSDGKIDLGVPVSGNLNDPKFDYGDVIRKAIVNLITGIVTAPFRLLGRLFGGGNGDEVSQIGFEPGSARLLPPEREKLARLKQGLDKRPELKLQVPTRYDAEADARALKRAALRRELGKRGGLDLAEEDPPGPVNIEDRRIRAVVREVFAERFSAAELDRLRAEAEAKDKARPVGEQQKLGLIERFGRFTSGEPQVADPTEFYRTLGTRLIASQPLAADALAELARRRGAAIADTLKNAGIDAARIAVTTAAPGNTAEAKAIAIELALTAR